MRISPASLPVKEEEYPLPITIVSIASRLKKYDILPNPGLQRKLDYYITPYNSGLVYQRHMKFEEQEAETGSPSKFSESGVGSQEKWKSIANFLLQEDDEVFR